MIQTLLRAKLIERRGIPGDARRYELHATSTGRALCERSREISDGLEAVVLSCLTPDQVASLNATLITMIDWIESAEYRQQLADFQRRASNLLSDVNS